MDAGILTIIASLTSVIGAFVSVFQFGARRRAEKNMLSYYPARKRGL